MTTCSGSLELSPDTKPQVICGGSIFFCSPGIEPRVNNKWASSGALELSPGLEPRVICGGSNLFCSPGLEPWVNNRWESNCASLELSPGLEPQVICSGLKFFVHQVLSHGRMTSGVTNYLVVVDVWVLGFEREWKHHIARLCCRSWNFSFIGFIGR